MPQERLVPDGDFTVLNAYGSYMDINDDPSNSLDNTTIEQIETLKSCDYIATLSAPVGGYITEAFLRFRKNAESTHKFEVIQNGTVIFTYNPGNLTDYESVPIPLDSFLNLAGTGLRIRWVGSTKMSMFPAYLYAVDLLVTTGVPTTVPPDVPKSLSPADGFSTGSRDVTFQATLTDAEAPEANDKIALFVEYSTSPSFSPSTTVFSPSVVPGGVASISVFSLNNGTYYWRAKAKDSGGLESGYTAVRSFTVDNKTPLVPTNMSPANNAIITTTSATLSATSSDPEGDTFTYEFQYSKDFNFATGVFTRTSTTGSYNVTALTQGNWYWRVRAKDTSYSGWSKTHGLFVNIPSTGRLSPDTLITQTNLSGALSTIQDDPDTPDANWMTNPSQANAVLVVGFPTPPEGGLKVGAGLQEFKARVKSSSTGATGTGTVTVDLMESGSVKATQSFSMPGNSQGLLISFKWDANLLTDKSGASADIRITGVGIYSGNASSRFTVQVGAVEWNYTLNSETQVPAPTTLYPVPIINTISRTRISRLAGVNESVVKFTFDTDVTQWEVRVAGAGNGTGFLADSGGAVTAGTEITATIDHTEGLVLGDNRVNLYGKNPDGWTPYDGVVSKKYYLQMPGSSNQRLRTPNLAFTEVVIDFSIEFKYGYDYDVYMIGSPNNMIVARDHYEGTDYYDGLIQNVTVDGKPITNYSQFIPNNSRIVLKAVVYRQTSQNLSFGEWGTSYFSKMKLWDIKLYDGTTLVAHYDFTKGNAQDQTGNGNHMSMLGGTFIEVP